MSSDSTLSSGEEGDSLSPLQEHDHMYGAPSHYLSSSSSSSQQAREVRSRTVRQTTNGVTQSDVPVYDGLRQLAGQDVLDFRQPHGRVTVSSPGGATAVVYLRFASSEWMTECWRSLQNRLRVSARVWPCRSVAVYSDLSRPGMYREQCLAPSSLVVLLRLEPGQVLMGEYTGRQLERVIERYLGCPPSREGRLSPALTRATNRSFELVLMSELTGWEADRTRRVLGNRRYVDVER